jgi:phosphoribosylanthranilate isomerase
MTVQVKICGIRTPQALDGALAAGVDYFGLVFYPPSPRYVEPHEARALIERARGRAKAVALLVDPADADIETILTQVRPDLIQLHGRETPERVAAIKARSGRPVIKAVKVGNAQDAAMAGDYLQADIILFDAKPPAGLRDALPGGNGFAFDWSVLEGVTDRRPFMLSGGLDATNVAAAVRETGAPIVDVSSGVERAPGDKDPELMRRFVAAAKAVEAVA